MLKNISRLEHKIDERIFHFTCDSDSPIEHVKESIFQFLKYIGSLEDQIKLHKENEKSDEKKEDLNG